jgi:hypothetical protein
MCKLLSVCELLSATLYYFPRFFLWFFIVASFQGMLLFLCYYLFLNDVYFWTCLLFCKILCFSLNVHIILRMFLLWYLCCCYSQITMLFSEFCSSAGCFSLSEYLSFSECCCFFLNVFVIVWKFTLFAKGKCYSPVVVLLLILMLLFEFLCYCKVFVFFKCACFYRQVNMLARQWCVLLTYGTYGSKRRRSPATLP